jgi:hypothetical protein
VCFWEVEDNPWTTCHERFFRCQGVLAERLSPAVNEGESLKELQVADIERRKHPLQRVKSRQFFAILVFRKLTLSDARTLRYLSLGFPPGALGRLEDLELPILPKLSRGIDESFQAMFVLLSRLQRQVWEEAIYPTRKKGGGS